MSDSSDVRKILEYFKAITRLRYALKTSAEGS